MQFLITGTFAVISLFGVASPCPSVCNCSYIPEGLFVDCSHRGLGSLPKDIPNNTFFLDISDNTISFIEEHAFSNLPALAYLDLAKNNIAEIKSGTFNNLPAFERVILVKNQIYVIEAHAFNNLPALFFIDLDHNTVSVIEEHAFNNLPALGHIDLMYNQISEIERRAFNNLPALLSLRLSFNEISNISYTYNNLSAVHSVYLDDNKITSVEAGFFSGMPNIVEISMLSNYISFVSGQTFQSLSQLTTLHFTMFCGCNFNIPFWQWLKVSKKFPSSIDCYDYPQLYMEELVQSEFYKCNEAPSTPTTTTSRTTASPTSRTTASPSSRTTSTPTSTITMTTTSAARITRKKLEATPFTFRAVIGIAIGAGSLAGGILLFCVIWRLWRPSKNTVDKFEQQPDKINRVIPAKPPSTFPQRPTENSQYII